MLPIELTLFITGALGALFVLAYRVGYLHGRVDAE